MSDLREQLKAAFIAWLNEPDLGQTMEQLAAEGAAVALATTQPALDAKDTENDRLRAQLAELTAAKDAEIAKLHGDVGRARDALGIVKAQVPQVSQHRYASASGKPRPPRTRPAKRCSGSPNASGSARRPPSNAPSGPRPPSPAPRRCVPN